MQTDLDFFSVCVSACRHLNQMRHWPLEDTLDVSTVIHIHTHTDFTYKYSCLAWRHSYRVENSETMCWNSLQPRSVATTFFYSIVGVFFMPSNCFWLSILLVPSSNFLPSFFPCLSYRIGSNVTVFFFLFSSFLCLHLLYLVHLVRRESTALSGYECIAHALPLSLACESIEQRMNVNFILCNIKEVAKSFGWSIFNFCKFYLDMRQESVNSGKIARRWGSGVGWRITKECVLW